MNIRGGFLLFSILGAAALIASTSSAANPTTSKLPDGCSADAYGTCPDYVGPVLFEAGSNANLPSQSSASSFDYQREVAFVDRPMISRIIPVPDADGQVTRYWQLRTITVYPLPRGVRKQDGVRFFYPESDKEKQQNKKKTGGDDQKKKYILVPFLLSTSAPHVHVAQRFVKEMRDHGGLEGESLVSTCNVRLNSPHEDVECVRGFTPNAHTDRNDLRKNILGGVSAVAAIAVQTALEQVASVDDAASLYDHIVDKLASSTFLAAYLNKQTQLRESGNRTAAVQKLKSHLHREITLLGAAPAVVVGELPSLDSMKAAPFPLPPLVPDVEAEGEKEKNGKKPDDDNGQPKKPWYELADEDEGEF